MQEGNNSNQGEIVRRRESSGVGWEWSGGEWSVEERKKAERGGGGWGCGSYANERDLRELSRSKRSKVILHNDG